MSFEYQITTTLVKLSALKGHFYGLSENVYSGVHSLSGKAYGIKNYEGLENLLVHQSISW